MAKGYLRFLLLLNVHMLEMEICLVLGQLDIFRGVRDELVDSKEKNEEDMLNRQEHSHPLNVCPSLSHCFS